MKPPRKHHYLPQFYLRKFSYDGNHIFQIERSTRRYYYCQIKDTAAIRDYHSDDGEGVKDPQFIEKELAKLESEHANDLNSLLSDGVINSKALIEIVGFLSIMRMRVPATKQYIERSLASQEKAKALALEKQGLLPTPPPGYEEVCSVKNLQFTILNWKCLEIMFRMAADPITLGLLYRMRATLVRNDTCVPFITSDQPVSIYIPAKCKQELIGIGVNHPKVEIALPLSSSNLLLLDNKDGNHGERFADIREVNEFNRRAIIMAKNYIFSKDKPKDILNMIRQSKGKVAGFTYRDIDTEKGFLQIHNNIAVGPKLF